MRISQLSIENYSRLEDRVLEVREHMVLVGPNDVGKSSLLRALDLLLGATTAALYQRLTAADFRDKNAPLIIEAVIVDLDQADEELFPDEIRVDETDNSLSLTVRLTAVLDSDENLSIDRAAPHGGTKRQLRRDQLEAFGWRFLSATGLSRDLREDRRSAVDDILETIDLGAEKNEFDALAQQLRDKLDGSSALEGLRESLSDQLTRALPQALTKHDLAFVPGAVADDETLRDVRLQVTRNGEQRSLAEQSDGTRALYAIALYDLVSAGAHMVAIDEPEIHLHPTSQRSLARLLQAGGNQKFVATHSADIVGSFAPSCVVAVRAGGTLAQPAHDFLDGEENLAARWWVRGKLEPLTASHVVAVEGISDRILLEAASEVTGRFMDRAGVAIVETNGFGDMGPFAHIFGSDGFDIPLTLLIDADATAKLAKALGINEADLSAHRVHVSDADLEAEYVAGLGADAVWKAIEASKFFSKNEMGNCETTGSDGERTDDDVAAFCRRDKYKARAALAIVPLITKDTAGSIASLASLLDEVVGPSA